MDWVTILEASRRLNVSQDVIRRYAREGRLQAKKELASHGGTAWGVELPEEDGFITKDSDIDEFGHVKLGGTGEIVGEIIEQRTGIETRVVTLGHLQRGGAPSAYDRVLGTRLGIHAARLAHAGQFGQMVSLRGTRITPVPLADAVGEMRTLEAEFMEDASEFFT